MLLVEDNPADVRLMREVLREGGGCWPVTTAVAKDGIEAMQRLRAGLDREAGDGDTPGLPDLVLLDLNLPPVMRRSS